MPTPPTSVGIYGNTIKDGTGDAHLVLLDAEGHVQVDLLSSSSDQLPTALTGSGNLKVAVQETLPAGEAHVGQVGGSSIPIIGTVTRPAADTTQYTAGDAITDSLTTPTAITFANCARVNAGSGFIVGAHLVDSANQATKLSAELWLFSAPATPDNDNAVFTPTDAELLTLVGVIQFNTWFIGNATVGTDGNAVALATLANPILFATGAASRNLTGLLVARNSYVPIASEVLSCVLRISQD